MSDVDNTPKPDLLPCPFCGFPLHEVERSKGIFFGQTYSDRYPEGVAKQNHGFSIRCEGCGCQTCWWHYDWEAIKAWNNRHG